MDSFQFIEGIATLSTRSFQSYYSSIFPDVKNRETFLRWSLYNFLTLQLSIRALYRPRENRWLFVGEDLDVACASLIAAPSQIEAFWCGHQDAALSSNRDDEVKIVRSFPTPIEENILSSQKHSFGLILSPAQPLTAPCLLHALSPGGTALVPLAQCTVPEDPLLQSSNCHALGISIIRRGREG